MKLKKVPILVNLIKVISIIKKIKIKSDNYSDVNIINNNIEENINKLIKDEKNLY